MTLLDTMNGPIWILWAAAVLCAALAVTFLSGRGSWLIAGYNTSSKKEKENTMKRSSAGSWAGEWPLLPY